MARSRQFTQLGIELIGASGADADFEVVSMAPKRSTPWAFPSGALYAEAFVP